MDGSAFDSFTRLASKASTRRLALRTAVAGSVASAVAAVGLASMASDAEAKKKCKKKKCPVCAPLLDNAPCTTNLQCCTNETNRACAVPENAGNSDKKCCGATGATCGGRDGNLDTIAPFCCADFSCSSNTATPGTCQPVFSPI